jgi:peptidoglycan/LPS O-acetylase OafA/YrhL
MPKLAMVFGGVLLILGLWGYFGSSSEAPSPTALIPAAFGALLMISGMLGLVEGWRKHAMHVAAAVALLGVLGAGGRALAKVGVLFSGEGNPRPVLVSLTMGLLCLIYLGLSIRSFIQARRRQREGQTAA